MILLYWYCMFFGAIKPVHWGKHSASATTAAERYQDQEWTGVSAGHLFICRNVLYQYCLDKLSLRLGGGEGWR